MYTCKPRVCLQVISDEAVRLYLYFWKVSNVTNKAFRNMLWRVLKMTLVA